MMAGGDVSRLTRQQNVVLSILQTTDKLGPAKGSPILALGAIRACSRRIGLCLAFLGSRLAFPIFLDFLAGNTFPAECAKGKLQEPFKPNGRRNLPRLCLEQNPENQL